jgi:hypothetical protein
MLYVLAMNIRPLARRALTSSPIVLLAVLAFSGSAGATTPTSEIEGVWSFSGGAVTIGPAPTGGTLQGTVVETTTFAACPHPAGEVMWTNMTLQPDGSFAGLHQWYRGSEATCEKAGTGLTAWRVLTNSTGGRVLKVCFSNPGDKSQPTIAVDGKAADVTYGCYESNPLAPPSEVEVPGGKSGPGAGEVTFSKAVTLPTGCVAQSSLKIALKDPKYDPLTEVVVKLNGKRVADVKGIKRLKKGITLKKLPSGTYKVSVVATTVLKQRLTGSQTYKSCMKGSGKIKLKGKHNS